MPARAARLLFRSDASSDAREAQRLPQCLFHEQAMEQLREAVLELREQVRQGVEAVSAQSRANGEALTRLAESQTRRRELCARQEERLGVAERSAAQHRQEHQAEREEARAERADLWGAVNKLRFHVYVWLGVGLVLQVLAPLALRLLR